MMTDFKHPDGIQLVKFMYMQHCVNQGGTLPNVLTAHACWHYAKNGMQHLAAVDDGATYEGDDDQRWGLDAVMHATQILYEIESRDSIMQHMRAVKAEAARCGLPFDDRLFNPVSESRKGGVILGTSEKFRAHISLTRNDSGDNDNE